MGLESTTRGFQIMYSNRQSVMVWWRRRMVRATRSQVSDASWNSRKRRRSESNHVLQAGSRRVFSKSPTKGYQELRCYGRPYRRCDSPIVDRPLRLRETPAPFTSRSPGIATLGPSCTPSRQLSLLFQKALNEVTSRRCSWHQVHSLGCSPDRQLSVSCDLPTKV